MKISYIQRKFTPQSLIIIEQANSIIKEYENQGYDLTLRQLYYQFVSRDIIPNRQNEYKKLGSIINDARLAGLIDWNSITDRTRNVRSNPHWKDPKEILEVACDQFSIDKRETQNYYLECWIEKDALVGVIEAVCRENDVPFFSCRGYTSQSEMWEASQRILRKRKPTIIIHLGDHDPSGIDMSRDITERLELFCDNAVSIQIERIALNYDQISRYNPPPNPAKMTDSRFQSYVRSYGRKCWELDALDPTTITDLISDTIDEYTDRTLWDEAQDKEFDVKYNMRQMINKLEI